MVCRIFFYHVIHNILKNLLAVLRVEVNHDIKADLVGVLIHRKAVYLQYARMRRDNIPQVGKHTCGKGRVHSPGVHADACERHAGVSKWSFKKLFSAMGIPDDVLKMMETPVPQMPQQAMPSTGIAGGNPNPNPAPAGEGTGAAIDSAGVGAY